MKGHIPHVIERSGTERHATWLELFFDLAYVAVVAQLTYFLIEHHTIQDFVMFAFLFLVVFTSWFNPTILKNIHEEEDTLFRLATQLQMLFALGMGVFVATAFGEGSIGFAISYIMVRVIHVGLQMRLYRMREDLTPRRRNILNGYIASIVFWTLSLLVPPPYRFILWVMGLAMDILAPYTKGDGNKIIILDKNHLPERLGLFTMLVMGESVIVLALVNNLSNGTPFTLATGTIAALGFVLMVGLWWLYFQYIENYVTGRSMWSLPMFVWSHVALFLGIMTLAAGLKLAMKMSSTPNGAEWFCAGGVLLTLMGFSVLKYSTSCVRTKLYIPTILFAGLLILLAMLNMLEIIAFIMLITGALIIFVLAENMTCFGLTLKKAKHQLFG